MKKKTGFTIASIAAGVLAVSSVFFASKFPGKEKEESKKLQCNEEKQEWNDTNKEPHSFAEEPAPEEQEKKEIEEILPNAEPIPNEAKEDLKETDTQISQEETEEREEDQFYISSIPDDLFQKMQGKSYKALCTIGREELRYVHILHTGFDGETKQGELVVNKAIAEDVLAIFKELYQAKYPIEKVRLVDEYDANDEASMRDNNSSAFNFRFVSHTTIISKHGLGMAIDINPLYNPYVKTVDGRVSIEPANAAEYVDRTGEIPYKIDHEDLCYKLFTKYGFTWGGDWTHAKDYQHFER